MPNRQKRGVRRDRRGWWVLVGTLVVVVIGAAVTLAIVNPFTSSEEPEPAPRFSLLSAQGRTVSLTDYAGQKHVVLVFYRGFF